MLRKMLLGQKMMMHSLFDANGEMIPVTFLKIHPNFITQIKTKDKDGYDAVQIATHLPFKTNLKNPQIKHFAAAKMKRVDFCQEMRTTTELKLGTQLSVSDFSPGMLIDVVAFSKGKGTAGVVKRHNFARGPMTHGSKHHRAPGSVGLSRPDKVWKGQPLPGRMGHKRTTIQNLEIIQVQTDENVIALRGAVPGPTKGWVQIQQSRLLQKEKKPCVLHQVEQLVSDSQKQTTELNKEVDQKNSSSSTEKSPSASQSSSSDLKKTPSPVNSIQSS